MDAMKKSKFKNIEKMLEKHRPFCTIKNFTGPKHCSCGRDEALKEFQALKKELEEKKNA